MEAEVDLWHGPDNAAYKMRVYAENGSICPFGAMLYTPSLEGHNTIAVRNVRSQEFPVDAFVVTKDIDNVDVTSFGVDTPLVVQGGSLHTYKFNNNVDSVRIYLQTDGRPLNARIELLQGPNNMKQTVEIYTESGTDRPCFLVLQTPGTGYTISVYNTAPIEFPLTACVEPYQIGHEESSLVPVLSKDYTNTGRRAPLGQL